MRLTAQVNTRHCDECGELRTPLVTFAGEETRICRECLYKAYFMIALPALAEIDLDHCPSCGGPADNGNDREYPPNPYVCSKCERAHCAKYARTGG